jgi:hypothetical protein
MTTITITEVTPAGMALLMNKLAAENGARVIQDPNTGGVNIDDDQVKALAMYDKASQTLTLQINSHPFWITPDMIRDGIQKILDTM